MKTLIVHHIQPIWDKAMQGRGISFEEYQTELNQHLKETDYSKVIFTMFEEWKQMPFHYPILDDVYTFTEFHEYGYGWHIEEWKELDDGTIIDECGNMYCEGGFHSQVVAIDDWLQELPKKEVDICGVFDGECVEDLEVALSFLKVPYKRINELIY